ncbi:MAG: potassium transporter TrkA [Betaproteobacteria bacterium RIFCSPLOWO2_12_FULL_64_23]|nr:MAG: potassium transporter TrkA [Betaproteobacteria bacterium RIFCSPLOWO2_12_FULL_64_23]
MAADIIAQRVYRRFAAPAMALVTINIIGMVGYKIIGGPQVSWLDSLYMTFITVATIGFGEIVDLGHSPGGRVFTMAIGLVGIGVTTYLISTLTAFILEGDMNQALRRRRMQKNIQALRRHYIICGIGRVGTNVAHELNTTGRLYVVIESDKEAMERYLERYPEALWTHADSSEDSALIEAGIEHAAGVFAVTGDDSKNLVITLSAKLLNPAARVVARCHEVNYIDKIRKVGADAIVSPDFTGGMRIASSMIRPQVVSFLDEMLRSDKALRVEEVHIPEGYTGRTIAGLKLNRRDFVLLAVRAQDAWEFNPADDFGIGPGNTLVVMTTPEGRKSLERSLAA